MISAEPDPPVDALTRLLVKRAAALAEARIEDLLLEQRDDPRRWRRAGLLWPLFAKG